MSIDDDELQAELTDELRRLRGTKGKVGAATLVGCPKLLLLTPTLYDPSEKYDWVLRWISSISAQHRYLYAAAWSVFSSGPTVLDRLVEVAATLDVDQRTVRTWSDRGLPLLATSLIDHSRLGGGRSNQIITLCWSSSGGDREVSLVGSWSKADHMPGSTIIVGGKKVRPEPHVLGSLELQWTPIGIDGWSESWFEIIIPDKMALMYGAQLNLLFVGARNPIVRVLNRLWIERPPLPAVFTIPSTTRELVTFRFAPLELELKQFASMFQSARHTSSTRVDASRLLG